MLFSYRVQLDREDGEVFLVFPEFPEIVSAWSDEELAGHDFASIARDALLSALQGRIDHDDEIPQPTEQTRAHQTLIYLPPLTSAKLQLCLELRKRRLKRSEFASKLGIRATDAQRLFDLGHESRSDQILNAFAGLGLDLATEISVRKKIGTM